MSVEKPAESEVSVCVCVSLPAVTGVDHRGDGRLRPSPRILEGDANANLPPPPDFVMLQNFTHQKVGSKEFFVRSARQIVPRTNTVHIVWC